MIGGASLPKATLPTPATAPREPHAASTHADRADEARGRLHEQHERDTASHGDRTPAHGDHAPRAQGTTRAQRTARRSRDGRTEGDEAPARDMFARLLDQAPAPAETPKAPTVAMTATPDTAPAATDTNPTSLPDQLLGLLASLAPGTQATPANAAAPTSPPVAAQPDMPTTTATALPVAKPATPPLGADAAAALLPALQAGDATANAATATTTAIAGALHTDETTTPLPALHAGARDDTPAPTPFDALLRAPNVTAADVPRPVVPATPTPVAQPADPRAGYGDELGNSVVWMADQRVSHAEVRVVPDHLGPIDVRLQLDGAQVHATFLSAQPEVRHALEASLPRLRDLLGQHGLQLAQADVGQRQQDSRATRGGGNSTTTGAGETGDEALASMTSSARARVVRGLLDEYA